MKGASAVGPTGRPRRLGVRRAIVGRRIVEGDVSIKDGRIEAVGLQPAGRSGLAVPGLVDIQVNGYAGVDAGGTDAEGIHHAGRALAADGVLGWCPTIITASEEEMSRGLRSVGRAQASTPPWAARVIGAHVEGPFLASIRAGVHPRGRLRDPDLGMAQRLLRAGPVVIFSLAPELPGALEVVSWLSSHGIVVSAAHSDATAEAAHRAFAAGVRATTHTWNGMRPLLHRDPGIVGAALADPSVRIGLIGDGLHVAPEVLVVTWRAARRRICLVTDAVAAARAPDGSYRIGEVVIESRGGRVLDLEGRVGGGTTPLLEAVRLAIAYGIPLTEAFEAATANPAALLGRHDVGILRSGGSADVLVLDDELRLVSVFRGGVELSRG